jgi:hypothetical protein
LAKKKVLVQIAIGLGMMEGMQRLVLVEELFKGRHFDQEIVGADTSARRLCSTTRPYRLLSDLRWHSSSTDLSQTKFRFPVPGARLIASSVRPNAISDNHSLPNSVIPRVGFQCGKVSHRFNIACCVLVSGVAGFERVVSASDFDQRRVELHERVFDSSILGVTGEARLRTRKRLGWFMFCGKFEIGPAVCCREALLVFYLDLNRLNSFLKLTAAVD